MHAEEGQLVGGRYQRVRTLGKGAYGLVVLAKDVESGEQVRLAASALLAHACTGDCLCLLPAAWHSAGSSWASQVAIKFIERREVVRNQKNIRREIVNHSALMHPHIIQFRRWESPAGFAPGSQNVRCTLCAGMCSG